MTISSENRKAGPFAGNGSATSFPFDFKVFEAEDVVVTHSNVSGVEQVLDYGVHYSVTLNVNQDTHPGGSITVIGAAPGVGEKLAITSGVPSLQPLQVTNLGGFYPAVLNGALDRLTILVQQLKEEVSRSVRLPITLEEDVDNILSYLLVIADNLATLNSLVDNLSDINTVAGIEADVSSVAASIAYIQAAVADLPSLAEKVSKTGDTMTGSLSVPAGASGSQVPQSQEVKWSSVVVVPAAGTSVDVTGIPADAEEIYIGISSVGHPASAGIYIMLGDSSGAFPTNWYSFASSAVVGPSTVGVSVDLAKIPIRLGAASNGSANGGINLSKLRNTGEWSGVGTVWSNGDTRVSSVTGRCYLGDSFAFDRLRFLCGTGSFLDGEFLIKWRRS